LRNPYKEYRIYNCSIPDFKERIYSFLNGGWKLALQRLSEWGNLTAITFLVGFWSNTSLRALAPAIQANILISLSLQGMAQASMVFIGRDCAEKNQLYKRFKKKPSKQELQKFLKLIETNKFSFFESNYASFLLSAGLSGGIFFLRKPIINLFLGDHISAPEEYLAESLLIYNLIAMIPDALRTISGGILRGWGDLLFPTLISIFFMTILSVSVGGLVSHYELDDNPLPLIWARAIAIALASIVNYFRFAQHIKNDTNLYLNGEDILEVFLGLEEWEKLFNISKVNADELLITNRRIGDYDDISQDVLENNGYFSAVVLASTQEKLYKDVETKEPYSEESLKALVAEEIVNQLDRYLEEFDCDKETFINNLKTNVQSTNQIIVSVLEEVLQVKIIIIKDNDSIDDLTQADVDRPTIYLLYGKDQKYSCLQANSITDDLSNFKSSRQEILRAPRYGSIFHPSDNSSVKKSTSESDRLIVNRVSISPEFK